MKHLNESLLSGVSGKVSNQDAVRIDNIMDWLKTHHGYSSKFTDVIDAHVSVSKDGAVDTDKSDTLPGNFDIKLGKNETGLPDFMSFHNMYEIRITTEAKTIDLSNFGNVENIILKGPNLISITGHKNLNTEYIRINASKVKTIDLEEVGAENIEAHCPNILLNNIKLSKNIQVCWLPKTILTNMYPNWEKFKWMGDRGR